MSTPDPDEAMGMANDPYTEEEASGTGASPEGGTAADAATSAVGTGAESSGGAVGAGEGGEEAEDR
ncbi:hypothetical protein [Georgenia sp. AZ-5]|uniref:hypothetical protein n=1 Tax=Georgenia sp. AZ-5 TaxID=3367526 RepID=UPI00375427F2